MNYKYYERCINKKTIGRYDVTPLFVDKRVFHNLILDMIKPFKNQRFNKIVGLDALGFILGSAIAIKLKKGFVTIRKGGKLPAKKGIEKISFLDYDKKTKKIEINKSSIKRGDKILISDEWIETGAQVKAAIKLIENNGAKVIGITTVGLQKTLKGKENLKIKGLEKYNLHSIITY